MRACDLSMIIAKIEFKVYFGCFYAISIRFRRS